MAADDIRRWGAGDGTWIAANWGGTLPGADEICVVPKGVIQDISSGPAVYVDLNAFITEPDTDVDVATSGSPANFSADLVDLRGNGDVYIQNDHTQAGGPNLDQVMIRPSKPDAVIQLTTVDGAADQFPQTRIASGDVTINSGGGAMAQVEVSESAPGMIRKVELLAASGTLATLIAESGIVVARNVVTLAYVGAGATLTKTDNLITTGIVRGTLMYHDDGTIALLSALPGSRIVFKQLSGTTKLTVTTLYEWPGSTIEGLDDVDVTNHFRWK